MSIHYTPHFIYFISFHSIIGTKCIPSLGVPEFDIATNVLNLIYAQTLAWYVIVIIVESL